ncbi:MAG: hypothetical protein MN733_37660 [Nitrososphaera sp.]|nr:hypothetical protein [Nitrososphaera sp.]
MEYHFRTTKMHWVLYIMMVAVVALPSIFVAFIVGKIPGIAAILFFVAVLALDSRLTIRNLRRTNMRLTEQGLSGYSGGVSFELAWSDVIAIRQDKQFGRTVLLLGLQKGMMVIPLQQMNKDDIWRAVQHLANPATLQEDAYLKLPGYQQLLSSCQELISRDNYQLQVTPPLLSKIVHWITVLVMLIFAVKAWESSSLGGLFCFSVALLAGYAWVSSGSYQIDSQKVLFTNPFVRRQIKWEEVSRIEFDPFGNKLALLGSDKCLVLPQWSFSQEEIFTYIQAQLRVRQVEVKRTMKVGLRRSKNVTVRE